LDNWRKPLNEVISGTKILPQAPEDTWSERMIGTEVKVHSRSQDKWLEGTIRGFHDGIFDHCKAVEVRYKSSGKTKFVATTRPLGERIRP